MARNLHTLQHFLFLPYQFLNHYESHEKGNNKIYISISALSCPLCLPTPSQTKLKWNINFHSITNFKVSQGPGSWINLLTGPEKNHPIHSFEAIFTSPDIFLINTSNSTNCPTKIVKFLSMGVLGPLFIKKGPKNHCQ